MSKLSASELVDRLKNVYSKNKKDSSNIGTGADLFEPPFYIKAPDPLQKLIGLEGYPGRRITQIAGKPNSGKSTLAMLAMIEAQKSGMYVLLIDTEGKFSKDRYEKMGGNFNDINIVKASTLEEGFTSLNHFLEVLYGSDSSAKTFVVWDSIGGTPSLAEAETEADDTLQLATAAKVIKRNLRVLVPKWVDKYDVSMLFINTTYANIGSVGRSNSGGEALEYASSIIMQLSRVGNIVKQVKGERVLAGITTKASITKNHLMKNEHTLKELLFKIFAYSIDFDTKKEKVQDEEIEESKEE